MPLKITYISVSSSYSHSSPVYGQLRAFTEQNYGSNIEWLHIETSNSENFDQSIRKIIEFSPNLIVSTAYLFNIETIIAILSRVSSLSPNSIIALGGPEFLGNNEQFLRINTFISAVFRGDESPLPNFLSNLTNSSKWSSIDGICYLEKNRYIDNGTAKIQHTLDSLPSPYEKGYFSLDKPFIHFETSRGCPSQCSFCSSADSKLNLHSVERVESDLTIIKNSGVKEIRILDRTFNIPSQRAVSLVNLFISKFQDIKFHLEIDPSKLTEEFIEVLSKAPEGMLHIEAGIQTLSQPSLNAINRTTNIEEMLSNLSQICSLKNIKVHTDLIAGLPLQTFSDVIEDIKVLTKLKPDEIQLETLKILPGSPLRGTDFFIGTYSLLPPYEILETPSISFSELIKLKVISRIIDIYHNTENLRLIFSFALKTDQNFLDNFAELNSASLVRKEKPSMETRFSMIYLYASKTQNKPLYELALFISFIAGIIPRKFAELNTLKSHEIEKLNRKTVFVKDSNLSFNHAFFCRFDSSPLEFITQESTAISQTPTSYIFYFPTLSFSKSISHIEEIIEV